MRSARQAAGEVVVYARVSSADQRGDLDRQLARVAAWTTGRKLAVSRVVTEIRTAPCVRLYGRRGAGMRARRAVQATTRGGPA